MIIVLFVTICWTNRKLANTLEFAS